MRSRQPKRSRVHITLRKAAVANAGRAASCSVEAVAEHAHGIGTVDRRVCSVGLLSTTVPGASTLTLCTSGVSGSSGTVRR